MLSFPCKACESAVEIIPGQLQCKCPHCGTVQSVPEALQISEGSPLDSMVFTAIDSDTSAEHIVFDQIATLEDPQSLEEASESADEARKNGIYYSALSKMGGEDVNYYRRAIAQLESIRGWKDADALIEECEQTIKRIQEEDAQMLAAIRAKRKKRKLLIGITVPLAAILSVLAVLIAFVFIPEQKYQQALSLSDQGKTVEAYEAFIALSNYKDSRSQAQALFETYKAEKLKSAAVGEIVYFGDYEQDNNTANGKESIEWLVLDRRGNRLLLLSRYGLDCHSFHESADDVTWDTCSLRTWLNADFLEEAFDEAQQRCILTTKLPPAKNEDYNDDGGGEATEDKLFLLSIDETMQYLHSEEQRQCVPTAYSLANGTRTNGKKYAAGYTSCWYLRSSGFDRDMVAYVQYAGTIRAFGTGVNSTTSTIRPAMRIQLNEE